MQRGPRWRSDRQRRAAPADADDEDLVRRRSRRKGAPALRLSSGPCPAAAASWHRRARPLAALTAARVKRGRGGTLAKGSRTSGAAPPPQAQQIYKPANAAALLTRYLSVEGVSVTAATIGGLDELEAEHRQWAVDALEGRDISSREARPSFARPVTRRHAPPRRALKSPSSPVPPAGARRDAGDEATRRGGAVRRRGGGGRQRGGGAAKARGQVCGQAGGQAGGKTGQESGWRAEGGGLGVHALVQGGAAGGRVRAALLWRGGQGARRKVDAPSATRTGAGEEGGTSGAEL